MCQMHHVHCALCVIALNAHLRTFLDLKPVIRFHINWLLTNRMKVIHVYQVIMDDITTITLDVKIIVILSQLYQSV